MYFDNVYVEQKQANGDTLLVKKNLLLKDFSWTRQSNGDILLKRVTVIDARDISKWDFKGSKIQSAVVADEPVDKPSFKKVYETIHCQINDGVKIIMNSILNIKTIREEDRGFAWYPELGISIQGVDANKAITEAATQCEKNNISLELQIVIDDRLVKIII